MATRRTVGKSTQPASIRAERRCPARFLSDKVRGRQSATYIGYEYDRVQAGGAHVPLPAFNGSAMSR